MAELKPISVSAKVKRAAGKAAKEQYTKARFTDPKDNFWFADHPKVSSGGEQGGSWVACWVRVDVDEDHLPDEKAKAGVVHPGGV